MVHGDAGAGLFALGRRPQQELAGLAHAQALNEIEERAMLESSLAAAVLFAAGEVLFDEGCP